MCPLRFRANSCGDAVHSRGAQALTSKKGGRIERASFLKKRFREEFQNIPVRFLEGHMAVGSRMREIR
jgi:hypothetical protein